MRQATGDRLEALGWTAARAAELAALGDPALEPGRIVVEHRGAYGVAGARVATVRLTGRFLHALVDDVARPAVGDWVALAAEGEAGIIHHLLPRTSVLTRRRAGKDFGGQVVAANVDVVFVVTTLGRDFNLRRLERYLTLVSASGAAPCLLLTKADLCPDPKPYQEALAALSPPVPFIVTSAHSGAGMDELRGWLAASKTGAMVGSSGVGKSSLLNALLGELRQETREVRLADDRGRHTTTRRELFELPGGGCLIDTPGMRELGLWEAAGGTEGAFEDVAAVAAACRFRDCRHGKEPGCAVVAALADGTLDPERWGSFDKQQRELAFAERQRDERVASRSKQRWKGIHRQIRARRKVDPKLRED